jgi:hypothetical protein
LRLKPENVIVIGDIETDKATRKIGKFRMGENMYKSRTMHTQESKCSRMHAEIMRQTKRNNDFSFQACRVKKA